MQEGSERRVGGGGIQIKIPHNIIPHVCHRHPKTNNVRRPSAQFITPAKTSRQSKETVPSENEAHEKKTVALDGFYHH